MEQTKAMTLVSVSMMRRRMMEMMLTAIFRNFVRYTIEKVECNITTGVEWDQRMPWDVIFYRCTLQAIVGRTQYGHKKAMLMHTVRIEID